MRTGRFGPAAALTAIALAACGSGSNGPAQSDDPSRPSEAQAIIVSDEEVSSLVQGNNRFALDLYARLGAREGNLFFSPNSISTALAMVYAGARGSTADEMARALHFDLPPDAIHASFEQLMASLGAGDAERSYALSIANRLWAQQGYEFLPQYLNLTEQRYGARVGDVDFRTATEEARIAINAWVAEQTRGKIVDLIKPGSLNATTRLVLTNAIYFKGNWHTQFKTQFTRQAPFTVSPGNSVQVDMMNQAETFGYADRDGVQVLELPYVDEELSMFVLLPKQVDGLAALESELTAENLDEWTRNLRRVKVNVFLPKFTMRSGFELGETLRDLGIETAFGREADFSGMTDRSDLFISSVVHQAFVEVNEEGTEAAAATGVQLRATSARVGPPPIFRADHPFVFMIRQKQSGAILFLGRFVEPA